MRTLLLLIILGAARAAAEAEAELIVDAEYPERVRRLILAAEERIDCLLYLVALPEDASERHPVRRLLDALIDRHEAGAQVRVLLDAGAASDGHDDDDKNRVAARYLRAAGVAVRYDEAERRSHCKSLCVDGQQLVVGSSNWSWTAFNKNREHAVLLRSAELGERFAEAFEPAWIHGRALRDQAAPAVEE